MLDHRKVAIFWDYENCSPPSSSSGLGYDIANNLGRMARVFGCVSTFKAYLDISAQSQKSLPLRSELQSSGVSMIDCPHNGKKEVVDKMILVDMLAFAVDNPAPATVILIAGDRDYAYAMATLRLRKYNVILIVPQSPHVHVCLESQASVVIDWTSVVLRTRIEATSSFMREPYRDLGPPLIAELSKAIEELHVDSDAICSTGFSSQSRQVSAHDLPRPSTFPNGIGDEASALGLPVPKTPTRSRRDSVSAPLPSRTRSATVSTQGAVKTEKEPAMHAAGIASKPTGRRSSAPSMTDITCPSTSSGLPPEPSLELPVQYDGPPSSIIVGSPLEPQANNGEYERPYVSQFNRTSSTAPPFSTLSGGVRVSSDMRVDMSAAHFITSKHECNPRASASIQDEAALRQALEDEDSADDQCMPRPSVQGITSRSAQVIVATDSTNPSRDAGHSGLSDPPSVVPASTSSTMHSKSPPPTGTSEGAGKPSRVPPASSAEAAPPGPPSSSPRLSQATPSVDQDIREKTRTKFQPLIHVLLLARTRGIEPPLRSQVALDLIQLDKSAYQRVGVSRFRDYTALAAEAGLIQLGGQDGKAWIALHPRWFCEGAQAETHSSPQSSAVPSLSDTLNCPTTAQSVSRQEVTSSTHSSPPYLGPAASNASLLKEGGMGPISPRFVPVDFQPLIAYLVGRHRAGFHRTFRYFVKTSLGQNVYARAKVANFDEYVDRAMKAGLVQCEGNGIQAWIRLHPKLAV